MAIEYRKLTEADLDPFMEMGVVLYTDYGFKKNPNFMYYP